MHIANHKNVSRCGYDKKVYVISKGEVCEAKIRATLSVKGVVTGYSVLLTDDDKLLHIVEVPKRYAFDDEEVAKKKLFKLKLNNFKD